MTARNNTFLHSLNPEIFKKWIFFSGSVKGILRCCIMHNCPTVKTNIKTTKTIFSYTFWLYSKQLPQQNTATSCIEEQMTCKCNHIKHGKMMFFVLKKNHPRYQEYSKPMRTDLLGRKISLLSLFPPKFLVAKQSFGALGSYVLTNPQQHLFWGNATYKCFRELRVTRLKHIGSWTVLVPLNTSSSVSI